MRVPGEYPAGAGDLPFGGGEPAAVMSCRGIMARPFGSGMSCPGGASRTPRPARAASRQRGDPAYQDEPGRLSKDREIRFRGTARQEIAT
jgi:hypothetical protein